MCKYRCGIDDASPPLFKPFDNSPEAAYERGRKKGFGEALTQMYELMCDGVEAWEAYEKIEFKK